MKKLLMLLLVFVLVTTLIACGSESGNKEENKFIGKWQWPNDGNIFEFRGDQLYANGDLEGGYEIDGNKLTAHMTFGDKTWEYYFKDDKLYFVNTYGDIELTRID